MKPVQELFGREFIENSEGWVHPGVRMHAGWPHARQSLLLEADGGLDLLQVGMSGTNPDNYPSIA